jgi:hypothetical protein
MQLLIASTAEDSEEGRQRTLDKSSKVLLDGISSRTEREARSLGTPVMIVFTFGVLLPLVFIAIVPFMSLMGIGIGASTIALLYLIGLPMILLVLIRFIAGMRPITVAAPKIPEEKNRLFIIILAVVVGLLPLSLIGSNGPMAYVPILWGLAFASGIFFISATWKGKKIRKAIKQMEASFGENLHQAGIILSKGRPLENALIESEAIYFNKAANNVKTLNCSLHEAFYDKRFGSLRDVYSDSIKGVVDIMISIADKGSESIAQVCFKMAEHMNNLKKGEETIERSLGGVVSSMRIIAMFVAPLVGGMIASMSMVMAQTVVESQDSGVGFSMGVEPLSPELVTIMIGIYIVESAVILVSFGADLLNGDDKVLKKYYMGTSIPLAVIVFTVCVLLGSWLFGGLG